MLITLTYSKHDRYGIDQHNDVPRLYLSPKDWKCEPPTALYRQHPKEYDEANLHFTGGTSYRLSVRGRQGELALGNKRRRSVVPCCILTCLSSCDPFL